MADPDHVSYFNHIREDVYGCLQDVYGGLGSYNIRHEM